MSVDHMAGRLREVDAELLAAIREHADAGREVYAVSTWRGRWALVRSAPQGYLTVRVFNRATFWTLHDRRRIRISDTHVDLDVVAGLPDPAGRRQPPHPERGRRIILTQQTGATRS